MTTAAMLRAMTVAMDFMGFSSIYSVQRVNAGFVFAFRIETNIVNVLGSKAVGSHHHACLPELHVRTCAAPRSSHPPSGRPSIWLYPALAPGMADPRACRNVRESRAFQGPDHGSEPAGIA